jgi:cation:H+ antiporter
MTTLALFLGGLAVIVAGAELFTNAVEWAGFRLHLAGGATGSLLAALGTALPETTVPIVALIGRGPQSDSIAIGAVVGAPFLLLTLGVAVTGIAVALRRGAPRLLADPRQVRRDLGTFLIAQALLLLAVPLPRAVRAVIAVAVLGLYAGYVGSTLRGGSPAEEAPEPLHLLRRHQRPPGWAVALQLIAATGLLIVGAELFVHALERAADAVHLSALVLSLVLVPVATELPETFNSVLWVRSRDDGLAIGNVAGATAFQACIPGAVGLAFTTWSPGRAGLASMAIGVVAALWTLLVLRDGRGRGLLLVAAALPWAVYVAVTALTG